MIGFQSWINPVKVRKCEVVLFSRERFSYLDAGDETPQQQKNFDFWFKR